MAGDAEATRRRLLDAAAAEFAEYGIAGARVDRIAAAAKSNKAQIYHYFTNKDGLFDAVMRELAEEVTREAPIDATDLGEYAARLHDQFTKNPVKARLGNWYRLEGSGYPTVDLVAASTRAKLAAVTSAQEQGHVPARFDPLELLALVQHLSSLWSALTPEMESLAERIPPERRRQIIVDAVNALLKG